MKKRILLLCLMSFCVLHTTKGFEYEQEWDKARTFLKSKGIIVDSIKLKPVSLSKGNEIVLFYDNNCFVLMATMEYLDYLDSPVLAYSLKGGFKEDELTYGNLFLFYEYALQLQRIKGEEISYKANIEYYNKGFVYPLLGETAWGNGAPYNKFCPTHSATPDKKTKASSLGVAMAQIMKYYKHPSVGRGKFSYDAGMKGSIDFEKIKCDWTEDLLDRYDIETSNNGISVVARLITATSVSVGTKFGYKKSLSSIDYARPALVNHFGFSPRCALLSNLSIEEIMRYAYQEIEANRPLIYTRYVSQYGTHSMVCDGFDRDYLHFNMGLGGVSNGYYRLLQLDNSSSPLSSIIIGIEPDKSVNDAKEVTIKKPGTLNLLLSEEEIMSLRKLTIKGKLNNADVVLLRRMAGADKQSGNLMELDLFNAEFVTDKKSYYLSESALGYSAWATKTLYEVSTNYRGYYYSSKTPVRTKNYSFDFYDMDEKKWKEFCSVGLNKGDGFFFSKNEDGYYINYHTQKGMVSEEMFKNCLNLRRIVLPKKTKSVGERAFENCFLLEEVSYDEKVTEIESSAFKNAYSYGDSIKRIRLTDVDVDINVQKAQAMEEGGEDNGTLIDDRIFQIVGDMPEFPGGNAALQAYLKKNIKYPESCQEQGIQGRVIVQFVVNADGSIVDPQVIKSVNPYLDEEALRVISGMPRWHPGRQRGKAVRVKFTLPVTFRFSN